NVVVPAGVQPPERPVIQSFSLTNGLALITWSSIPGCTYRLQSSDSLLSGEWTDASTNILATSDSTSASHPVESASQRVYRVLLLP
ncbi:MAG TPA: hypothetical protein P5233_13135, partial [Candidatus Paceibacterota bacterium]|nr:hypothetical protein [Candidatus Paceibacterota bacterium]